MTKTDKYREVLKALNEGRGASIVEIGRWFSMAMPHEKPITRGEVEALLNDAQDRGHVERHAFDASSLMLTAKGAEFLRTEPPNDPHPEDYGRLLNIVGNSHYDGITPEGLKYRFGLVSDKELNGMLGVAQARRHVVLGNEFPFRYTITPQGRDFRDEWQASMAAQEMAERLRSGETPGHAAPHRRRPQRWTKRLGLLMFALKGADGLDRFREALAAAHITSPADVVKIEWSDHGEQEIARDGFIVVDDDAAWATARVWYMERVQRCRKEACK